MIGAIFLDSDFATVKSLILKWFEPLIEIVNADNIPRDYKSRLQETLQAKKLPPPVYDILREEGPDHDKVFFISCSVSALQIKSEGQGESKKIAEQEAAKNLLALL